MPDDNGRDPLSLLNPEEQVAYEAPEVQLLLEKESVKAAFRASELRIFREWQRADNPLAREMCWHKQEMLKVWKKELANLAKRTPLHLDEE
jgi:hypothetical protein